MAAMLLNIGEEEYCIESPDGETGTSVPYGEVANHDYGGHTYISYCTDPDEGDTQIYRLAGPTLLGGLELVETDVQIAEFAEDGEAGEGEGDGDGEDAGPEGVDADPDGEDGEDAEDGDEDAEDAEDDDPEDGEDGDETT